MESFFSALKIEQVHRKLYRKREQDRADVTSLSSSTIKMLVSDDLVSQYYKDRDSFIRFGFCTRYQDQPTAI